MYYTKEKISKKNPVPSYLRVQDEEKHPVKIILCGLMKGKNYGDVVISDCVKFLIKKFAKEMELDNIKVSTLDIRRQKDKKSLNRIRNCDGVIFPGGGFIKFRQENLPPYMDSILSRAEHYGIPVAFNAVGVEGYDAEDEQCMLLKNMLHRKCVRYITSRDFSEELNSKYLDDMPLKSVRVSDPAVFAGEVYKIKRNKDSDVVGLGVAREGIFEDYGLPVSKAQLLDIWKNISEELHHRGIKYKFFTNGLKRDEDFLDELLAYLGKAEEREKYAVSAPESAKELVRNISAFSSIIACRMHASIIAFSLDIPAVGFVWNDKITAFAESIGCADRFFTYEKLTNAKLIADTLQRAQQEGYKRGELKKQKKSAEASVKSYFVPFADSLMKCRYRDTSSKAVVCYGLPNLDSPKLNDEFFERRIDFFVSDDKSLINTTCLGRPVCKTSKLRKFKKPFVIVSETVEYPEASAVLEKYGYKEKWDYTNMHSYCRYAFAKGEVFFDEPKEEKQLSNK